MIKNIKMLFLVSLTFVACTTKEDTAVVDSNSSDGLPLTAGTANFSKYVAVGNSLTSGYCDGALFKAGQEYSYPNIMAQQFALVGGGEFKIPYCGADNLGGLTMLGTVLPGQGTRMAFNGLTTTANPSPNPNLTYAPGIYPIAGTPVNEITNPAVSATGSYNNVGVPGAKSYHLLSPDYGKLSGVPVGTANPYFARFMNQTAPVSMLTYATAQTPTFFSLWIGNNDVLSYATSGGTGVNQSGNLNPATYGKDDITDTNVFANVYNNLINGMTAGGAKGVVANIPYVTTIPFFTTVPTNPIPITDAAQVAQLNGLFGNINAALVALGQPKRFETLQLSILDPFTTTYSKTNPLLIVDETLPNIASQITTALTPTFGATGAAFLGNQFGQARHAKNTIGSADYILLTTKGLISPTPLGNNIQPGIPAGLTPTFAVRGVTYPLQDSAVLTADEASQIKIATDAFNATIKSLATAKGLAFVDANAIMAKIANGGISGNGYLLTNNYATGGAFSYDGVHPCQRGYALIANKFIEAINTTYGSNLKGVDLSKYKIAFPASL